MNNKGNYLCNRCIIKCEICNESIVDFTMGKCEYCDVFYCHNCGNKTGSKMARCDNCKICKHCAILLGSYYENNNNKYCDCTENIMIVTDF